MKKIFLPWLLCAALVAASPPDRFTGPQSGESAPEFALYDLEGQEVRLEQFRKKDPVVLVTGSYSCPIFRQRLPALQNLYEKYKGRASFYILYTVEAHPSGSPSPYSGKEWVTEENQREQILVPQPSSYDERANLVSQCRQALHITVPTLIDDMDNAVWAEYGKAPNAAYLIDSSGKVQLRQGWFEPASFEQTFLEIMQEEPPRWDDRKNR